MGKEKQKANQYNFKLNDYTSNKLLFDEYLEKNQKLFDDYLDLNIYNSDFYSIYYNDNHIGFFTLLEKRFLTCFFVTPLLQYMSKDIFAMILQEYSIEMALATSFDEQSICMCLDYCTDIKTLYYYYKQSGIPVRSAEYPASSIKKAQQQDAALIKQNVQDFIDMVEYRIDKEQLYILLGEDNQFIGLGVIINHKLQKGVCSFGLYIKQEYRQTKAGRSMLLHLMDIAKENGLKTRCACPKDNKIYGKTLESAGFVNDSRLLLFTF